ncbi:MAG: DNA translocase FtsK 4TM domain-containing protein [Caldilineaceae bacterium]|nr:DNA translocase FtsK 4TM domain-containing protein [Caldilineaceae bacterium]
MAQKRRSRKSSRRVDPIDQFINAMARPEVAGLLLILLSVFTLLSLLTGSRGEITAWWIGQLERLVGMGVWGLPLVTAALGLWIVIRAIERMPDLPWQRPAGFAVLFLVYVVSAALLVDHDSVAAGGLLGAELATRLYDSVGLWAAWSVVTFTGVIGVVLLTDRLLLDGAQQAANLLQEWVEEMRFRRRAPVIRPPLPIPSGELPWWKRLRKRFTKPRLALPLDPPNLIRPEPRPISALLDRSLPAPARPQPAATPPSSALAGTAGKSPRLADDARGDILTPRIVGGAHEWRLPRVGDILTDWERQVDSDDIIRKQGRLIQETLALFGVPADFEGAFKGPSVTQYLIKPGYIERTVRGEAQRVKVKVSKIAALANDLALALAASSVRIEAPIPGTSYVGVEVPNQEANIVGLKELMENEAFQGMKGKLRIALGEDVKGQPILADLTRMPHLLIAGATGTGKSVCINSIITCLLLTKTPDELRLLMVDPKMVELSVYNGVPHLLSPVVTELDRAAGVLFWAVKEMERRYQLCSKVNARDLERYNAYLGKRGEKPLPYIVIVVDEMADLMMAAPEEVEKHICRLAQMARAVGIHLIIATQRPSVDVITGLIKANFPARIAFAVSSQVDSRVILDVPGAERLLGRGDMLFMGSDANKLERIQGTFVSDEEINRVIRYWRGIRSLEDAAPNVLPPPAAENAAPPAAHTPDNPFGDDAPILSPPTPAPAQTPASQPSLFAQIEQMKAHDARDELFAEAMRVVRDAGRGSVSLLQRKLRIGYSRASRLVDQLEEAGVLGPDLGGNQGRAVLIESAAEAGAPPSSAMPRPRIIGGAGDGEEGSEDRPGSARPRVWM